MSAQFDRALTEAAETLESCGLGWNDIGPGFDDEAEDDADAGFLPLEFQLDDLETAVDLLLQERDRFLYGEAGQAGLACRQGALTGKET